MTSSEQESKSATSAPEPVFTSQQRDEIRRIATEALVATLTSVTNRGAYRA